MTAVKSTRQEQAAATRQRVLDAAYEAFCQLGYRATTMALVAERAGVAVQTVYFIFRTKDALLQEVHDQTVVGRPPVVPPEQPWFRAMVAEPDPAAAVRELVAGTQSILARVAPMLPVYQAVAGDPAGEIFRRSEALRRQGMHDVAAILRAKDRPRAGLGTDQAGDLLVVLLGPEVYRALVLELGWTAETWIAWTSQAIVRELFGQPVNYAGPLPHRRDEMPNP